MTLPTMIPVVQRMAPVGKRVRHPRPPITAITRIKRITVQTFLLLIPLLLSLACATQQQASPFVPPQPTAAPNIAATVTARDNALPRGEPTSTPVPAQTIQAAQQFQADYAALSAEWDALRRDVDGWRQGLVSCDASSLDASLRGFYGDFSAVSLAAQDLPRHPMLRDLADRMIEAARIEESALRYSFDPDGAASAPGPAMADAPEPEKGGANGMTVPDPDNGGSVPMPAGPVFDDIASARAASLDIRNGVADRLTDLQAMTSAESEEGVNAFVAAFDDLGEMWDEFHEAYDDFRAKQPQLSSDQALAQLNELVEQRREITLAHRDLPLSTPATRHVAYMLADTVREEDLALRRLRGSFQEPGTGTIPVDAQGPMAGAPLAGAQGPAPDQPLSGSSEEKSADNDAPKEPDFGGDSPPPDVWVADIDLLDDFDRQVAMTNDVRRDARLELEFIMSESSAETRSAVDEFAAGHASLLAQWQRFHGEYDEWEADGRGCDAAAAIERLGGFVLRMGDIATAAEGLPKAAPLRPLGELTVEAARRHEEALRQTRNAWRPFDPSVYDGLDSESTATGKLRRQVDLALQELLKVYGIAAS